ncbi:hypothetical protein INR49_020408 [Caranx melampygus]|nr:hypothetical protein INR49_020408 [Caranx melampygus]
MAASALRRGLLSTVSKYNKKHTHRILCVADTSGGFEAFRPRIQCRACGLPSGVQPRRFMSSRVFGYRGIVLFPWHARLYDRDITPPMSDSKPEPPGAHGSKEVKGKTHTYYQVLIDTRDCPHISQRSQTEAVTFLANHDDSRALYAIPGLDYVSHEDILPYNSTEQVPIQHELFERFLMYNPAKCKHPQPPSLLSLLLHTVTTTSSSSSEETTENIRVTVIPFYMGMREAQNSHVYWWRYCIRLENMGNEEPVLSKEQPAFQYSSHVSLQAPSGHMWGTFRIERTDGSHFDVRIPPFSLESNKDDKAPPAGYTF